MSHPLRVDNIVTICACCRGKKTERVFSLAWKSWIAVPCEPCSGKGYITGYELTETKGSAPIAGVSAGIDAIWAERLAKGGEAP